MGQAEQQEFWQDYDDSADLLGQALDKLVERGEARKGKTDGLTGEFSEQAAIKLMERAMEALATEYISHLEAFKEAIDPVNTLEHLEESEVLWRDHSRVILKFDPNGEEGAFIGRMRALGLTLFIDKLEEVADRAAKNASAENMACCIGLMAVIDHIWEEQGRPLSDPERQELRTLVKAFR